MRKFIFAILLFLALAGFRIPSVSAQALPGSTASDVQNQLNAAAGSQGANLGQPQDPRLIAANIIRFALQLLGTIFVALTVYAGFLWMTAGGNEDNIGKSKKILTASVIGLFIILSAYSITWYVTNVILSSQNATNGLYGGQVQTVVPTGGYGGPGCCFPNDKTCDQNMNFGDCTAATKNNPGRGSYWTDNCATCM